MTKLSNCRICHEPPESRIVPHGGEIELYIHCKECRAKEYIYLCSISEDFGDLTSAIKKVNKDWNKFNEVEKL